VKKRLDVLLVERGLVETRARAAARILAGDVVVNDHRVDKAGTSVDSEAEIRLKGDGLLWVSRGGLKLDAALKQWPIAVRDAVCVDVGASTGGFTEVLLHHGARLVHAVDVGRGQLHERMRQHPQVRNVEQTHITKLAPHSLEPVPSVAVIDVSFISLRLVLPATLQQLTPAAHVVALIKPQFEVGKQLLGKGGIVRDDDARARSVEAVLHTAHELGLAHLGTIQSPITGTDGNIEFLAAWSRA
jgi:23S rRNA (cytidine1920-2'-O)/16S rRNA (cytidine1409-2'-O)-methyltransferase